jgi:hypothetical protein
VQRKRKEENPKANPVRQPSRENKAGRQSFQKQRRETTLGFQVTDL